VRTQVAIVGAGPTGLLLARLLQVQNIDAVLLEWHDRAHAEQRPGAALLECGTAQTLRDAGIGARLDAAGLVHHGVTLAFDGERHRIDLTGLTGRQVIGCGEREIVAELIAQRLESGAELLFEVDELRVHDVDTDHPAITFARDGDQFRLDCDFVIGADGAQGARRRQVLHPRLTERSHPFAWLDAVIDIAPDSSEPSYGRHPAGATVSTAHPRGGTRIGLQIAPDSTAQAWTDDRIRTELRARFVDGIAEAPILDRHVAPVRTVVADPIRHGRLLLAGDAAHVVPAVGSKGLNLAVADVRLLSRALGGYYADGDRALLDAYSDTVVANAWRVIQFSSWLTALLHVGPGEDDFESRLALENLRRLTSSDAMATAFADHYTGLPDNLGWSYR
jgi:p-hydroxybenzoate 3-monooxygenase